MTDQEILIHALTQYDIKQSKKASYNRYALAHYFFAIDVVLNEVKGGINIIASIEENFNQPLRSILIKALDASK